MPNGEIIIEEPVEEIRPVIPDVADDAVITVDKEKEELVITEVINRERVFALAEIEANLTDAKQQLQRLVNQHIAGNAKIQPEYEKWRRLLEEYNKAK